MLVCPRPPAPNFTPSPTILFHISPKTVSYNNRFCTRFPEIKNKVMSPLLAVVCRCFREKCNCNMQIYVGVCVCGCVCVCGGVCVGFWLQLGICFDFYPVNWGHTAKRGYPQFLVWAVNSITGAIECVKARHLAIGGNVTSCPVKSLNSMIIYRSTGCPHFHGV